MGYKKLFYNAREARQRSERVARRVSISEAQRAERVARRVSSREAARSVGREAAHIGPRSGPQDRASVASSRFFITTKVLRKCLKFG